MIQPLHEVRQATFTAVPQQIVMTFPTVPQGLRWTGTITTGVPYGEDPQGIVWTLFRNGTPFMSGWEFCTFADVQAVGQETIKLVGYYVGSASTIPQYQFTAVWEGFSGALAEVPVSTPYTTNSTRGLVQVYNTNGPDQPLAVTVSGTPTVDIGGQPIGVTVSGTPTVDVGNTPTVNVGNTPTVTIGSQPIAITSTQLPPDPSSEARLQIQTSAGSGNIMPVPAHSYQIWEIGLQVACAQLSTVAGVQWQTATIQTTDATPIVVMQSEVVTLPGTADSNYMSIPMHGYQLNAGVTLELVTNTYGGSHYSAVAVVTYSGS